MAQAVVMPKAGITVETCSISRWQKQVGEQINIGDVLFTYETDKSTFECESTAAGELLEKFYDDDDEVPVLVNVCAIGAHGESVDDLRPDHAGPEAAAEPSKSAGEPAVAAPHQTVATQNGAASNEQKVNLESGAVSPRARRLAAQAGVKLEGLFGSGPYGRVIERDIRRAMEHPADVSDLSLAKNKQEKGAVETSCVASDAPTYGNTGTYTDQPCTVIRRAIAKSMTQSLSDIPQLTHHHTFDATELLAYRKKLKATEGVCSEITIGDMVLFAVSRVLQECQALNAHLLPDLTLRVFSQVNLGVAMDTPRGLMVPTIFGADQMSLVQISQTVKALAVQAREGSMSPDMLQGASFTVSNLGNFGVESFTPVINPPQTGILGVGSITDRVRRDVSGALEVYPAMGLSLTYDHRALDGAPAARFMKTLCARLSQFTTLLAQ